jgi:hypothetical protein
MLKDEIKKKQPRLTQAILLYLQHAS